ncbi:uncharacterized protein C3orf22 homolog isoform X2 [Macaca thibetana thibetana]|uniref:uncharacterized protein C3orf22 homolog isoform X2 n=1 Tax=Macaca thibetana thibetana TaxID=257877 RepID=UPI0021BC7864|nr:uncharacterized protein C3orf22 homolog isoform X2 [Macaca thibetana thibetana]
MDSNARKKSHLGKKWRIQAQENFVKKFPYRCRMLTPLEPSLSSPRFSGLTEPDPEPLHPWEVTNNLNTVELPLQKRLVPTRSIPVRGLRASDFISPSSSRPAPLPAPPPPPLCNLWELKLLSRRFPRQLAFLLSAPHTKATGPQTSEAKGPSRGRS